MKSLSGWAKDPRCRVSYRLLRERLRNGWALEEAIAIPKAQDLKQDPTSIRSVTVRRLELSVPADHHMAARLSRRETAFGVAKTLEEWVEDPRCVVKAQALLDRLAQGYSLEEALSTKCLVSGPGPRPMLEAFGEMKPPARWSEDPRCLVSLATLVRRLKNGMAPETAMTKRSRVRKTEVRLLKAFGETKTLHEWSQDPRCVVKYRTLSSRIYRGMPIEDSLTSSEMPCPTRFQPKSITAFGETKTLAEWTQDPRCRVSLTALQQRLSKSKLPPEQAITLPRQARA